MGPVTAMNVRRLGLIIEALCMLALLSVFRRDAPKQELLLGVPLYRYFQFGLGIGLILWMVGTISFRRAKRKEGL